MNNNLRVTHLRKVYMHHVELMPDKLQEIMSDNESFREFVRNVYEEEGLFDCDAKLKAQRRHNIKKMTLKP